MLRIKRFDYMSEELHNKVSKFVCENVQSILCKIPEEEVQKLFPETFKKLHGEKSCKQKYGNLQNKLIDNKIYSEITPLESYVLYRSIEYWLKKYREEVRTSRKLEGKYSIYFDIPEDILVSVKKELQRRTNQYDEEFAYLLLKQISNLYEYDALFFTNFYFEEEMLSSFVHAYKNKNQLFYDYFDSIVELDLYKEVMSWNLYQEYLKIRNNVYEKIDYEQEIVSKIIDIIRKNSLNGRNKYQITKYLYNDLFSFCKDIKVGIQNDCVVRKAVIDSNEIQMYKDSPYIIHPLCILDVDYITKAKDQCKNLLEKLNTYYGFGITISLNQKLSITSSEQILFNQFKDLEEMVSLKTCKQNNYSYLKGVYYLPESTETITIYHLVIK